MKLLVVDDDPLAGELTCAILDGLGYATLLAENAMDALEKLAATTDISMIICDMNMPLISGIDLFRELHEQGNPVPFVVLSGDAADVLQAEEPRLTACLVKDHSLEDKLAQLIADVLPSLPATHKANDHAAL